MIKHIYPNPLYKTKTQDKSHCAVYVSLLFFCVLFSQTIQAQICTKKTSIYFDSGKFQISPAENRKLDSLCMIFSQKQDTFLIEVHAHSDSIASVDYNTKLSNDRVNSVLSYLRKKSKAHFEITTKIWGEASPLNTNLTEQGRSKNRSIDIFMWRIKDGQITLKGKRGVEVDVDKNYFGPCGVCESNPKIVETLSNEEAARQGIPLTTTEGEQLSTGGMISLDFNCGGKKADPDAEITVRIPAENPDDRLELWTAPEENDIKKIRFAREKSGQMDYDAKNKSYVIRSAYKRGQRLNLDYVVNRGSNKGIQAGSSISLISAIIAVPELNRSIKLQHITRTDTGKIHGGGRRISKKKIAFIYETKGGFHFVDSGMTKDKIGYRFSGSIEEYQVECDTAKCRTQKFCWCFEVPVEAYTKVIYYQKDKDIRLKIPGKYRKYDVKLYIPAADMIEHAHKTGPSSRKVLFTQPLPETEIALLDANKNIVARIKLKSIPLKHKTKKKYYKGKIKRKQVKKAMKDNGKKK